MEPRVTVFGFVSEMNRAMELALRNEHFGEIVTVLLVAASFCFTETLI